YFSRNSRPVRDFLPAVSYCLYHRQPLEYRSRVSTYISEPVEAVYSCDGGSQLGVCILLGDRISGFALRSNSAPLSSSPRAAYSGMGYPVISDAGAGNRNGRLLFV